MKNQYVDIKKHWRKIRPFAISEKATRIWKRDLKKHHAAFRVYGYRFTNKTFDIEWFQQINKFDWYFPNNKPSDYDSCDWRYGKPGRGRKPAFWDYVVHSKCHWMVNFNLFLAQNVFPKEPWRIITANRHSCVWNGSGLLLDINFFALVPDITEHPYYREFGKNVEVLNVGEELTILSASDYDVVILDLFDDGCFTLGEIHAHFFEIMDTILLNCICIGISSSHQQNKKETKHLEKH